MSCGPILLCEMFNDLKESSMKDVAAQELIGFETMKELFGPEFVSRAQEIASRLGSGPAYHDSQNSTGKASTSSFTQDKKEFKVNLNVEQFKPEELKITLENGYVIIEGKHEERTDEYGSVSRQFIRKYKIPDDIDQGALVSKLSPDGLLTLQAPKKIREEETSTRELTIIRTDQPQVSEPQPSTSK